MLNHEIIGNDWPRQVNGTLIEPASGTVRVRKPGNRSIELELADVHALATAATHPHRRRARAPARALGRMATAHQAVELGHLAVVEDLDLDPLGFGGWLVGD